jgi:hypothetical protein
MCKVWFGCIFAPTVVSCGGGWWDFCSLVWILPANVVASTVGEVSEFYDTVSIKVPVNFINKKKQGTAVTGHKCNRNH